LRFSLPLHRTFTSLVAAVLVVGLPLVLACGAGADNAAVGPTETSPEGTDSAEAGSEGGPAIPKANGDGGTARGPDGGPLGPDGGPLVPPDGGPPNPYSGPHVRVVAAPTNTCAIDLLGNVKCWGENGNDGVLGIGSTMVRSVTPVAPIGLGSGVQRLAKGFRTSCAVNAGGALVCWGGDIGYYSNAFERSPIPIAGLESGVTDVEIGAGNICALTATKELMCWGTTLYQTLTSAFPYSQYPVLKTPVKIPGLPPIKQIAAAGSTVCVVTDSGGALCWGQDDFGETGRGKASNTLTSYGDPQPPTGLATGVVQVAVGFDHACALMAWGGVRCWGRQNHGQVGDGAPFTTLGSVTAPVDVVGLGSGVASITARNDHTCAVLNSGALVCWGANGQGQLGIATSGEATDKNVPTAVSGLGADVVSASAGSTSTCAALVSGAVKCWGNNAYGRLGTGTVSDPITVPTTVLGL
jgi:hypothetical protein